MGKPPAFQFYAADFDTSTRSWTPSHVGIFMRLLIYQWINGPLPATIPELARIAGSDIRNMKRAWSMCIAKMYTTVDSEQRTCVGWVNLRLEEEREKQLNYRKSQAEKGEKRAEQMWKGHIAAATNRQ